MSAMIGQSLQSCRNTYLEANKIWSYFLFSRAEIQGPKHDAGQAVFVLDSGWQNISAKLIFFSEFTEKL